MTFQPSLVARAPAVVAPLQVDDRDEVLHLLRNLPVDYPGARDWLESRLQDVFAGDATCWVARTDDALSHETSGSAGLPGLSGLVILTPKAKAMKLSTIFVAPEARGRGVGSLLLDRTLESARSQRYSETFVTVAHHKEQLLRPLLTSRGFTLVARVPDRYGPGRHELVFTCLES